MSTASRQHLRIVRGEPTEVELAALVAVVAARAAAAPAGGPRRSSWADPARRLRITGRPGPDAWRRSALPS
ncbi:MAG: hypothetical protein V7637_4084 [Mycobacteriales bacterium]